eukprot:Skav200222  [mRNA]  locus=scaffold2352:4636:7503:+ [translate_table: standard]
MWMDKSWRLEAWALVKESEPFLASLCGSSVRHTGFGASLSAPHGPTEQEVISTAVHAAGLTGVDIDACETYGIANMLADPVEVNSVSRVLRLADDEDAPLLLRASKTGIGNAMHAGSAVSLMQAILTSVSWQRTQQPAAMFIELDLVPTSSNGFGHIAICSSIL